MLKVKICGLTRVDDALVALQAGADFIGLNIFAGPRKITLQQASKILKTLPDVTSAVALVDLSVPEGFAAAHELATEHQVRTFQVYGELTNIRVLPVNDVAYWPVFRIARREDIKSIAGQISRLAFPAAAIVLDAFSTQGHGGTGTSIDLTWLMAAERAGELHSLPPIILAGGFHAENIAGVLSVLRPWAVDVASGVEVAGQAGLKDHDKVRAFVRAVRSSGGA
jgi:phosphoribosylanthranilate isomerase